MTKEAPVHLSTVSLLDPVQQVCCGHSHPAACFSPCFLLHSSRFVLPTVGGEALHAQEAGAQALNKSRMQVPTRVKWGFLEDGTKVRIANKSGAIVPKPDLLKQRRCDSSPVQRPLVDMSYKCALPCVSVHACRVPSRRPTRAALAHASGTRVHRRARGTRHPTLRSPRPCPSRTRRCTRRCARSPFSATPATSLTGDSDCS